MRLLLDTHVFLFAIGDPERLSPTVRDLLTDPGVERFVSVVSMWEIAIKVQIGKLAMPLDREFYSRQLQALRARPLPVEMRHSLALLGLPMHHRDPFDRLLVAQALEDRLTVVSRDELIARYPVETFW